MTTVSTETAERLIARFQGVNVLVVGDAMVDQYLLGTASRISPEAPVPVVRFQSERHSVGGAANAAHNAVSLGAVVSIVGIVGRDEWGRFLRQSLQSFGIDCSGLIEDPERRTTVKCRVVTERRQQVVRIDYEQLTAPGSAIHDLLIGDLKEQARRADVIIVSDYGKGVISSSVVPTLLEFKRSSTPVVVDPNVLHADRYAGATVITPNASEVEAIVNLSVRSDEEAGEAGRRFSRIVNCESTIITRGDKGVWLSSHVEGPIPATSLDVADVCGASDTFSVVLALALTISADLVLAASLANIAAGIVIRKFGTAVVSPEELTLSCGDSGATQQWQVGHEWGSARIRD